ncbi:MAG: hypothetical protein U0271_40195 [Polyangiaceae bacterium]
MAAAAERPTEDQAIELLDVLDGFFRVAKRSATLDGSVPLRAAQACTPLLEGNSVGVELVLGPRIEVARGRLGLSIVRSKAVSNVETQGRAVMPALEAQRVVSAPFAKQFSTSPFTVQRGRLRIFTGLFARVPANLRLRISSTANRRSRAFTITESIVEAGSSLCPIVLELTPAELDGPIVVEGDIATLLPLPARVQTAYCPLAQAEPAAQAHLDFYDRAYFQAKESGPTKKYRTLVARSERLESASQDSSSTIVEGGPRQLEIQPDRIVARAALDFSFRYDGSDLEVRCDPIELEELANKIRATWAPVFDAARAREPFRGALLYLTKYFTPHPRGEPHFFVKPPALVVTPPGWSTVIDGTRTAAFDVLRGVVETDVFHAVPLVFSVAIMGKEHRVRRGDFLAELFTAPRHVLETPVRVTTLSAWPTPSEGPS